VFSIILRKEIKLFLTSPLFYVLAGLFSLTTGWIFFNLLVSFTQNSQALVSSSSSHLAFINHVLIKYFGNMNFILLFFAPIIGMGIFAKENENESINAYFCAPITKMQLIGAKYCALLFIGGLIVATTIIFPFILWSINLDDLSFLISGYLGVFLNLACFLAVALFMSSLTKNQPIACISTIVVIFLFWIISWVIQISSDYFLVEFLKSLTMVTHFEYLIKGRIDTKSLLYYISFIYFWVFLTKKNMERLHGK
jgi:ABC-2 type transport system permease protein